MKSYPYTFLVLCCVFLTGCAGQQQGVRSSVVDFLYPDAQEVIQPGMAELTLPLRVGIAFVPEDHSYRRGELIGRPGSGYSELTAPMKAELLEQVANSFRQLDYVESIEVIPTTYLRPRGGFTNLNQIKTMYGIDVIALVSYDQVQFTHDSALSLTYWTLVGAYLFKGDKNDTSTLMDTVVYDIASQRLLFRAPGQSEVKGRSTPVNLSAELRQDSRQGFALAIDDMTMNLQQELKQFEQRLKDRPADIRVAQRSGGSGGAVAGWMLLLGLLWLTVKHARRRG
ncbi:rhombotarget lipoprotein [Alkalimonas sp. NCh-2]|uniref:rhombotarget lipoprotein n=1 Tax=Alkalimonas sp. NCh-2 TaxID=3144846 RepID=UPI0031F6F6D5